MTSSFPPHAIPTIGFQTWHLRGFLGNVSRTSLVGHLIYVLDTVSIICWDSLIYPVTTDSPFLSLVIDNAVVTPRVMDDLTVIFNSYKSESPMTMRFKQYGKPITGLNVNIKAHHRVKGKYL